MQKRHRSILAITALVTAVAPAFGAQNEPNYGIAVYPGARPRPEVARAVETYYAPSIPPAQRLDVGVFETADGFDQVYDFYARRMRPGKWGWRKKNRPVLHQTRTLAFLRAQAVRERAAGGRLPAELTPVLGDPAASDSLFAARLDALVREKPEARIQIVEGVVPVPNDTANSLVRVVVERPYLDPARMELVDRTRIQLIKVARPPAGAAGRGGVVGAGGP